MRNMLLVALIVIVAAAAMWPLMHNRANKRIAAPAAPESAQVERGRYLARAGDCTGCHTMSGGEAFAGGLGIATPFGMLYAPNITPDAEHGIGKWTAEDFWRALHDGRGKDDSLLYPAFPYTNYTKVTRADSDDMFAYFQSIKAVAKADRPHDMQFPYNQRKLLIAWRALYFKAGEYQPDKGRDAQWNRGAYLVQGLGHCNACHSARNLLGAVTSDTEIAGGLIPIQNWYAPALTSNRETGIGNWEVNDIAEFLKTGVSKRGAAFGPMAVVVRESLQYLTDEDATAIAVYLKDQAHDAEPPEPAQVRVGEAQTEALVRLGQILYEKRCASCHQKQGNGVPYVYPPLAGNQAILMRYPINSIRVVVNGGFPPSTQGNPRPYGMPPFGQDMSDQEIAAVVTYVRQAWGNRAAAVSPVEVRSARSIPVE